MKVKTFENHNKENMEKSKVKIAKYINMPMNGELKTN